LVLNESDKSLFDIVTELDDSVEIGSGLFVVLCYRWSGL